MRIAIIQRKVKCREGFPTSLELQPIMCDIKPNVQCAFFHYGNICLLGDFAHFSSSASTGSPPASPRLAVTTARRTRRGSTPGHVQNLARPPSHPRPRPMPPVSEKMPTAASRCRKSPVQWHGAAGVRRGASQRVSPCLRAVQAENAKILLYPAPPRAKNPARIFSLEDFPTIACGGLA
jgi:hypothetical protein